MERDAEIVRLREALKATVHNWREHKPPDNLPFLDPLGHITMTFRACADELEAVIAEKLGDTK